LLSEQVAAMAAAERDAPAASEEACRALDAADGLAHVRKLKFTGWTPKFAS
jgi:hypothetical protein